MSAHKKCLICNQPFAGRRDAKTCSPRCRKRLQLIRTDLRESVMPGAAASPVPVGRVVAAAAEPTPSLSEPAPNYRRTVDPVTTAPPNQAVTGNRLPGTARLPATGNRKPGHGKHWLIGLVLGLVGLLAVLFGSAVPQAHAATANNTLNFQARLLNAAGAVVPDGSYNIDFKIYNVSNGNSGYGNCSGSCLWEETYTNAAGHGISVTNGYLNVQLNSVNNSWQNITNWDQPLYLTMDIGGTSAGSVTWDGEMQNSGKDIPLTGVPLAFQANSLSNVVSTYQQNLQFASSFTQATTITLPDPGASSATVCYQSSAACGFALSSGSGNYIQNSTVGPQSANFNIISAAAGSIGAVVHANASQSVDIFDVQSSASTVFFGVNSNGTQISLGGTNPTIAATASNSSLSVNANGTGTLNLNNLGTANTIQVGNTSGAVNGTIKIGTNATSGATNTIQIGNASTATDSVTIGSNSVVGDSVNIEAGNTGKVQIGNTNVAHTIQIGAAGTSTIQAISVGSTSSTSSVTIQGGTGTGVSIQSAAGGTLAIGTVNNNSLQIGTAAVAGTIQIGGTGTTGQITLGQGTASNTISIGSNIGGAGTQTINIGTSSTASSTTNVTIGSTVAGTVQLQPAGGVLLGKAGAGGLTGSLKFNYSGSSGSTTLTLANPGSNNYTLTIPTLTANANICTDNAVCTGYAPASGSSNYIQNGTSVQTSANFAIQSAGTGNVTAVIKQNTSQTADLLDLEDSSNNVLFGFSANNKQLDVAGGVAIIDPQNSQNYVQFNGSGPSTGSISIQGQTGLTLGSYSGGAPININPNGASNTGVTIKPTNDSTTAFQVQNSSGSQLLNVNTSTTANLITNNGFEVNTTGWAVKNGSTISRITSPVYSGLGALQITTPATANSGAAYNYTFSASTQYTLSVYASLSSGSMSTLVIGRQEQSGTDIDCLTGKTAGITWVRYTCTFTTGATISSSNIYVKQSDAVARTIYIDAVQLETGAYASPYNPGGEINLTGVVAGPTSFHDGVSIGSLQGLDDGSLLAPGYTVQNLVSIGQELTNFNADWASTLENYTLLNPNASVSVNTLGLDNEIEIAPGNNKNITGTVTGGNNAIYVSGTGTYSSLIGGLNYTEQDSGAVAQGYGGQNVYKLNSGNVSSWANGGLNDFEQYGGTVALGQGGQNDYILQGGTVTTAAGAANFLNQLGNATISGTAYGSNNYISISSSVTSPGNTYRASNNYVSNAASGTLAEADSIYAYVKNTGNGTITNAYGINVQPAVNSGSGAITNNYGIYEGYQTAGTNDYPLYLAGSTNPILSINGEGATAFRNNSNSTAAFQVQNASGNNVLSVDTVGGNVNIGQAGTLTGTLALYSATSSNAVSIQAGSGTSAYTLNLPVIAPTAGQCLQAGGGVATQLAFGSCGGSLQAAYDASNTPATITTTSSSKGVLIKAGAAGGTTPVLVRQTTNSGTGVTSLLTSVTATGAGHLLVANIVLSAASSRSVSSVTDSAGNSWSCLAAGYVSGVNTYSQICYAADASSATSVTVNVTGGTTNVAVNISEYSGVALSSALDTSNSQGNTSSTSAPTPTITTTAANDLIIGGLSFSGAATVTNPGGSWTNLANTNAGTQNLYDIYQVAPSASNYSATWTLSSATASGTSIAAFRAAGAASNADSTNLFQVQSSTGASLLNADSTNMRLGVNVTYTAMSAPSGVTATTQPQASTPTVTPTGGSSNGKTWGYEIVAIKNGQQWTIASAQGTTAVGYTTLTSTAKNHLTWTSVAGATNYQIYRTTVASGGSPSTTGLIGSSVGAIASFDDTGLPGNGDTPPGNGSNLTAGTTYYYEVTAIDGAGGETTPSTEFNTGALGSSRIANLSWTTVSGASGYNIYRGTTSGSETYIGASSSNAYVDGLISNTTTPATPPGTNTAYTATNNANSALQISIGGNGTPTGQLYVSGTVPTTPIGSYSGSTTVGSEKTPYGVAAQGKYVYMASRGGDLVIFDASNPQNLRKIGSKGIFNGPNAVAVSGDYAYVVTGVSGCSASSCQLAVVDVSNPGAPTIDSEVSLGASANPMAITVSGRYAYIAYYGTNQIGIWDISNPADPINVDNVTTQKNEPSDIFIQGHYAFVSDQYGYLETIDISNPAAAATVSGSLITVPTTGGASSVYVQGSYAYVADTNGQLDVFDISDATAPVYIASVDTSELSDASVWVQDRYAYVADHTSPGAIDVIDISHPANPTLVGSIPASNPFNIAVQGRYLYSISDNNNILQVFDLGGTYTQQLEAGGAEFGTLTADSNAQFGGDVNIQGGTTIGQSLAVGGDLSVYGDISLASGNNANTVQIANDQISNSAFPATPILDNFNRANGAPGSNWNDMDPTYGLPNITSDQLQQITTGTWPSGYWTTKFRPDMEVYAQLSGYPSSDQTVLMLRLSGVPSTSENGYEARFNGTTVIINKVTNASRTQLGTFSMSGQLWAGFRALGNTLTAYVSNDGVTWTSVGSVTDSTYDNSGYIGFFSNDSSGVLHSYDNFGGGAIPGNDGNTQSVSIGSTGGASSLLLQSGTGNITLSSNGSTIVKPYNESTTAFQVQNTSGAAILNADTVNTKITFSDNAGDLTAWQTSASPLPAGVSSGSSVVANGYVYMIGGSGASRSISYSKLNGDGSNGAWTTQTNVLPVTSEYTGAVVYNGYLYIVGGWNGSTYLSTVYYAKLNPFDGSVSTIRTTTALPDTLSAPGVVETNGYIYVVGGSDGSLTTSVYYAKINGDGTVGAWQTGTSISSLYPSGLKAEATVAANGNIYLFGGTNGSYISSVSYISVNSDGSMGASWSASSNMPGTKGYAPAVLVNGYVYVVSGYGGNGAVYYAPLNNNGTIGTWNTASYIVTLPVAEAPVVTSNGYIYVLGGYDSGAGGLQSAVYYTSTARVLVGGSLDLVGLSGATLNDAGQTGGAGSLAGSLTAGNTQIVGGLQVQGAAAFGQSLAVGGDVSVAGQLYVSSSLPASPYSSLTIGGAPNNISVQNGYAFINYGSGSTYQIVDINNPASPAAVSTVTTPASPAKTVVQGHYAYTITSGTTFQVDDISNPKSPTTVGTATIDTHGNDLVVSGRYAYVATLSTSNGLAIIDISNPAHPVQVGHVTGLQSEYSVAVQGNYAYLVGGSGKLNIINISNPASPTVTNGAGAPMGSLGHDIIVQGSYAYALDRGSNELFIFNISDPTTTAAAVGTITTNLSTPEWLKIQGHYAYVTNNGNNTVSVYDISNPASPAAVGTIPTSGAPWDLYVLGRYMYVTTQTSGLLQVFDLGGGYIQQLEAGGLQADSLSSNGNAQVAGDINVQGGASIGGDMQVGGDVGIAGSLQIGAGSTGDTTGELLVLDNDTNATVVSGTGTNTPTEVDGAMFYSGTDRSFFCGENGVWRACLGGLVNSSTAVSSAISSTTTKTDFSGGTNNSYTVLANDCQAGVTYLITAQGTWTATSTTPTLQLFIDEDSTATALLTSPTAKALTSASSTAGWQITAQMTCDSTTAVEIQGMAIVGTDGAGTTTTEYLDNTATKTWSAANHNLLIGAKFSSTTGSPSITMRQFLVQRLGP